MHRSKQAFDGTVITEDSAELYDPTEPSQRVLVTMKLVQSTESAVEKYVSSFKHLHPVCLCEECKNATHFLLLLCTKKKQCYVLPAPFFASVPSSDPSQLRVFKKPCKVGGPGTCFILYPAQLASEWVMQLNKPEMSNGLAVRDDPVPQDCIRVICVVDGVGAGMSYTVRIVPQKQQASSVTPSVKHVASCCNEVLDRVANVELGEIPTKFCLTYSAREKHSSGWVVQDDGPVSLQSFIGETLYIQARKVESTSAALDEWIAQLAAAAKESPNVRTELQRLARGEGWWIDTVNRVTPILLNMSGRCLATFHESLYSKHPQKQLIRFLESRLHPLGESLVIRYMQPTQCAITVLNKSSKPIIVEAKLSTSFTLADGVDAEVKPRSVYIPEGKGHNFVLTLTGTAVQPADIKNTLCPHALCFWATSVDSRPKEKKSETQTPSQSSSSASLISSAQSLQQSSIPFIMPFKYVIAPDNKVADLESLPFVALDMMKLRDVFPEVQSCRVETVEFQNVFYIRKMLSLDVLLRSFATVTGEDPSPPDPQQASIVLVGVRKMLASFSRMRHPCLSALRWTVHDPRADALFLMFRYDQPPLTLYEVLYKQPNQTLPLPLRVKIAIDVGQALKRIHYFNSCLGTLNLNSICLTSVLFNCFDPKWHTSAPNAVLTDYAHYGDLSLFQLTPPDPDMVPFTAPELIEVTGKNTATIDLTKRVPSSDVFSYALVILSLLSRDQPYMDRKGQLWCTKDDLLVKISREHYMPTLTRLEFQPQILSTIHTCLWNSVNARPSIDEILNSLFHCMNVCAASPQPVGESGDQLKNFEKRKSFRSSRSKSLFFSPRNAASIPPQVIYNHSTSFSSQPASNLPRTMSSAAVNPPMVNSSSYTELPHQSPLSSVQSSSSDAHQRRLSLDSLPPQTPQHNLSPTSSLREGQTVSSPSVTGHRQSPSASSFIGEKTSALVRVIGSALPKGFANLRLAIPNISVNHILRTVSRSHFSVDKMTLIDPNTLVEVNDEELREEARKQQQQKGPERDPNMMVVVQIVDVKELVEVTFSLSSAEESDESSKVAMIHKTALNSHILNAAERLLNKSGLQILLSDCTVANLNDRAFGDQDTEDKTCDVALAAPDELVPVSMHLEFVNQADQDISVVFHNCVTASTMIRVVLQRAGLSPELTKGCELLDPADNVVADPATTTLQHCISRCVATRVEGGSYQFTVRDGRSIALTYNGRYGTNIKCNVVLPFEGTKLQDVLEAGKAMMNIPMNEKNALLATNTGVILLDGNEVLDERHIVAGLCVCDSTDVLYVYVDEQYAIGFVASSNPTASVLISVLNLSAASVGLCNQDSILLGPDEKLVNDGRYTLVPVPAENFHTIQVDVSGEKRSVTLHDSCTVAAVVRRLVGSEAAANMILMDDTDCVLDEELPFAYIHCSNYSLQVLR